MAVAGGRFHSLGLKSDGTIEAWGRNADGQCNVPAPNTGFVAVAGGGEHSLGLKSSVPVEEEPGPRDMPKPAMLVILSLAPNPFNPFTEISFDTRGSGHVTMEIYDVSGRRVRTVPLGYVGPGLQRARWDGRDGSGGNVPSGVYSVRLLGTEGESRMVKAVLVR